MEYIPIGKESAVRRESGLRLTIARLLLRILGHSCVCHYCERQQREEVIEF